MEVATFRDRNNICLFPLGTLPRDNDMLNNTVREGVSTPEHSFKSLAEIPSGPVAFAVDRLDSNALTSSTVTVIVSSWSCTDTEVVHRGVEGLGRNTEAKYWLKAPAFADEELYFSPVMFIVSGRGDLTDLVLKNFQKLFSIGLYRFC